MIRIEFGKVNGCRTLRMTGHAGYAEPGQDIVCAACSILAQGLIQTLKGEPDCAANYGITDGRLWLVCGCGTQEAKTRRNAMFDMVQTACEMLAETYPEHVQIKKPPEGGC